VVPVDDPKAPSDLAMRLACMAAPLPPEAAAALAPAGPAVAASAETMDLAALNGERIVGRSRFEDLLLAASAVLGACRRDSPAAAVWPEGSDALFAAVLRLAGSLIAALSLQGSEALPPPAHEACADALASVLSLSGLRRCSGAATRERHSSGHTRV